MNRGTEILKEILNKVKSMSLEEYDKFCEDSQHLDDIHIVDIRIDASLTYRQAIRAENIYKNFVLESISELIVPDNFIKTYANADMYIETDDILLMAA